jgi:hypothetical protein
MKQVIPFYKEIVFKNNIANLTSISLEHTEKVLDGEVSGEFIVYGDYKVHNDTTEKENFKYKLPFTALIPNDIDPSTVRIDISDFRYEQIDTDVLRIDIDFCIEGDEVRFFKDDEILEDEVLVKLEEEGIDKYLDEQINEVLDIEDEEVIEESTPVLEEARDEIVKEIVEHKEEKIETLEEYVTYHVHVVGNNDSIENIIKKYNTNLDVLNLYNDIKDLKVGDKVLIPEYNE